MGWPFSSKRRKKIFHDGEIKVFYTPLDGTSEIRYENKVTYLSIDEDLSAREALDEIMSSSEYEYIADMINSSNYD